MTICRLCLSSNEDRIAAVQECTITNLAAKIWDCVSVNINSHEDLPKRVCRVCIDRVLQWEIFRSNCQASNKILLNNMQYECKELKSLMKLEVVEVIKEDKDVEHGKRSNEDDTFTSSDEDETEKLQLFKDFSDLPNVSLQEETLVYQCDLCDLGFDNCVDYIDHQYQHKGKDIFKCDKCPEVFSTRDEIVYHEQTHRIPCQYCGKLILRSSMKLHLIKHTGRYKCGECKSSCTSKAALKQHIITVHTNIKDHICDVCGKCFSSLSSMRVHCKTHSDERRYPCKECPYAGRTASALYIHMSTHANDLCICEKCSKTFKSNRNLTDHIRRVHSENKKHKCKYCGKSFVLKYMLKVHTRCHTNVRPYQCSVCAKAFTRSDGLKEHMNTHNNRSLSECLNCQKKFTTRQGKHRHNCLALL